jgi:hypothetical protein
MRVSENGIARVTIWRGLVINVTFLNGKNILATITATRDSQYIKDARLTKRTTSINAKRSALALRHCSVKIMH